MPKIIPYKIPGNLRNSFRNKEDACSLRCLPAWPVAKQKYFEHVDISSLNIKFDIEELWECYRYYEGFWIPEQKQSFYNHVFKTFGVKVRRTPPSEEDLANFLSVALDIRLQIEELSKFIKQRPKHLVNPYEPLIFKYKNLVKIPFQL